MSFSPVLPPVNRLASLCGRYSYRPSLWIPSHINDVPLLLTTRQRWKTVHSAAPPHLLDKLKLSISSRNVTKIHYYYVAAMTAYGNFKGSSSAPVDPPLRKYHILRLLGALAASARPFDLELVEKILADMPTHFGLEPQRAAYHNVIIHNLLESGNSQTVFNWLMTLSQKPGNFSPTILQWHRFLKYCDGVGDVRLLYRAVARMHRSGCRPTNDTFKILLVALFKVKPRIEDFHFIIGSIARARVPYDVAISNLIYNGFVKHHQFDLAEEAQSAYKDQVGGESAPQSQRLCSWNNRIAAVADRAGTKAATGLCMDLVAEGYQITRHTLTLLLRRALRVEELLHVENKTGLSADLLHWSILVQNNLRSGYLTDALIIYKKILTTGLPIDTPLVHPLVAALCTSTTKEVNEKSLDHALEIYRDLIRTTSKSKRSKAKRVIHSRGADGNLYNILLQALGSTGNVKKYYPIALSLLEDMQMRDVTLDNPMAITGVLSLLMRCTSSCEEAFDVYKRMCRRHIGPKLDAKGFAAILNEFSKLVFGEGLPSVWHYFEIVKDMRSSGHEITPEIYTILLRQLAKLPESASGNDDLLATIRRVHNHLTLDPSISPDTALWNQLMDTYQRAGCLADAYRVWEILYLANSFDHISVSIILDACGFAGAWHTAVQICMKLHNLGFRFNQKNWNAWIECMCRVGKLDDAVKATCLEIGQNHENIAPDIQTARILLTFSLRTNQHAEVKSRIKRYLPQLWAELPEDLRDG